MINRTVLVGRLTKDVELTHTQSGVAKAQFTLAVKRNFSNQQGEQDSDFIRVIVWRSQAENVAKFLKKRHLAGVEGSIRTGSYISGDKKIYTTDVVADSVQFLEPKKQSNETAPSSTYNSRSNQSNQPDPFANGGQSFGGNNPYPSNSSFGDHNHYNNSEQYGDDDLPF